MGLGATVCHRRRPDCPGCPVRPGCAWHAAGSVPPDPADGSAGACFDHIVIMMPVRPSVIVAVPSTLPVITRLPSGE